MTNEALITATDRAFWLSRGRILGVFLVTALDESSDSTKSSVYGMGGLFGDQVEWNRFERLWSPTQKYLDERGAVYHTTDLENGRGDFEGWDRKDRTMVIKAMVDSIVACHLYCVHTAVDLASLKSVFPNDDERAFYELCFVTIIHHAAYLGEQLAHPVAFVLDQKPEFEFRCHAIYSELRSYANRLPFMKRLGSIGFHDRREMPMLLAADLVAYEGVKLCMPRKIRIPMMRLRDTQRLTGVYFGQEQLEDLRADADKHGIRTLRAFLETGSNPFAKKLQKTWKPRNGMMKG